MVYNLTNQDIQKLWHNKPGENIRRGPHADEALIMFCKKADGVVLDIGSGGSYHTTCMTKCNLTVETIDLAKKRKPTYVGDYNTFTFPKQFDGIWCSHTLEHQPNPNTFLKKIFSELKENGLLAITVPPAKNTIVSGHVTIWFSGLLIYHLILAGFDCSEAMVKTYDYNISVVVKKKTITDMPKLTMHSGDIERLSKYFPFKAAQGIDGNIDEMNWPK